MRDEHPAQLDIASLPGLYPGSDAAAGWRGVWLAIELEAALRIRIESPGPLDGNGAPQWARDLIVRESPERRARYCTTKLQFNPWRRLYGVSLPPGVGEFTS